MSEQELNLLQLTSCRMAELRARSPQVVRSKTSKAGFRGIQPNHMPDDAFRDAITPAFTRPADATEYFPGMEVGCMNPLVQCRLNPFRDRNRSNVPALANKIHYGPMLFSLLQMRELKIS
jgi:hypothetical protein